MAEVSVHYTDQVLLMLPLYHALTHGYSLPDDLVRDQQANFCSVGFGDIKYLS